MNLREIVTVPVLQIKPGDQILVAGVWREPVPSSLWSLEGGYVIVPLVGGDAGNYKASGTIQVSRVLAVGSGD